MRHAKFSSRGSATSNFIVWSVAVLALVLITTWLIRSVYDSHWVATDPRGFEGRARLAEPPSQQREQSFPEAKSSPPFDEFAKRQAAK